jgi:hypothetical protein
MMTDQEIRSTLASVAEDALTAVTLMLTDFIESLPKDHQDIPGTRRSIELIRLFKSELGNGQT